MLSHGRRDARRYAPGIRETDVLAVCPSRKSFRLKSGGECCTDAGVKFRRARGTGLRMGHSAFLDPSNLTRLAPP